MSDKDKAIQRGVEWLDENVPGWLELTAESLRRDYEDKSKDKDKDKD